MEQNVMARSIQSINPLVNSKTSMSEKLLECFNKCKYPNMCAEISNCARGRIHVYAEFAHVTIALLQTFMLGNESLTDFEIKSLANAICRSLPYLKSPSLSVYNLSNRKYYRKVRYLYHQLESFLPLLPRERMVLDYVLEWDEIANRGFITRAYFNRLSEDLKYLEMRRKSRNNPPRGLPSEIQFDEFNSICKNA